MCNAAETAAAIASCPSIVRSPCAMRPTAIGIHNSVDAKLYAQTNSKVFPCLYFDARFHTACATAAARTMAMVSGCIRASGNVRQINACPLGQAAAIWIAQREGGDQRVKHDELGQPACRSGHLCR